jgi:phage terminase large subunit
VLRKTGPAARKSVFALFKHYIASWGLGKLVHVNSSDMLFTFWNGSEVMCSGLDDPEKLKSIEGVTGMWLEEPTELSRDDFRQVDLRLRGKTVGYKQIIFTFNPISRLVWLYREFFEKPHRDTTVVHSTYRDNRFIDADYALMLEALADEDPMYHGVYALGEWGVLRNIIFENYDIVDWPPAMVFEDKCYGLDFGFTSPTALIQSCFREDETWVRQVIYETGLTNSNLIELMKRVIPDRSVPIYADPTEPAWIEEIYQAGFNIHPADNSVKPGIDHCRRGRFFIDSGSPDLIKEVGAYKYREDKNGNVMEIPVKFMDHGMDGMRYGRYTHHLTGTGSVHADVL